MLVRSKTLGIVLLLAASHAGTAAAQQGYDQARAHLRAGGEALAAEEYIAARAEVARALDLTLEDVERSPEPDTDQMMWAIASLAYRCGELEVELTAREWCHDYRSRALASDDLHLIWARGNLAACLNRAGDLERALELERDVAALFRAKYGPNHVEVLKSMENLALTLGSLGYFEEARDMISEVLDRREREHGQDVATLMQVRMNLAQILRDLGDYERARAYNEIALEWFERTDPKNRIVRILRNNLALTQRSLGDWDAALVLQRQVLEMVLRVLPEDHEEVQRARINLSETLRGLGLVAAARVLGEQAVEVREANLPPHHPDLALTRASLAMTLTALDDYAGALELLEQVAEAYGASGLPEDHPRILATERDRAKLLSLLGDLDTAAEVLANNLELAAQRESNAIYIVPANELGLAFVEKSRGRLPEAKRHALAALNGFSKWCHPEADELLQARQILASILAELGETEDLEALLEAQFAALRSTLLRSSAFAPREANMWTHAVRQYVWELDRQARSAGLGARWEERVFELAENTRAAAVRGLPRPPDVELAGAWESALHARRRVQDIVAELALSDESGEAAASLAEAILKRDQAEAQLSVGAAEPTWLERADLAPVLPRGAAAVGFLVADGGGGRAGEEIGVESTLIAHVLRRDGALTRIELGTMAEIEELVERWRAAIGLGASALATSPGRGSPGRGSSRAAGEAVRRAVLDPVIAALEDETTLLVCLDGPLHLLPLDAMPLDGRLVGDRYRLLYDVSFESSRKRERGDESGDETLVAFGGVAFSTRSEDGSESERRGSEEFSFGALSASLREVEEVAGLFGSGEQRKAKLFRGSEANKAAFLESAPSADYLHLATHGFFRDSIAADAAKSETRWNVRTLAREFAPLSLCGIALAGANDGRDSFGGAPGVLTGEELSRLDLWDCELAVLSACDTSRGVRTAGRGLQSLQIALHAAGVRTTLTSLWSIEDESARLLMEEFYRRLWVEGEPPADALWNAKNHLRSQRVPTREWAGWVLTESF